MSKNYLRTITKNKPYKVCFVCLGNICRSPTAEGVFIHKVKNSGLDDYFEIDSAGTAAYHVGEGANSKSQSTANKYGIHLPSKARKLETSDLKYYDLILAMDSENFENINRLDSKNSYQDKIRMMREFDPQPGDGEVPDPYFGGMDGFENVYRVLDRSTEALLDTLKDEIVRD